MKQEDVFSFKDVLKEAIEKHKQYKKEEKTISKSQVLYKPLITSNAYEKWLKMKLEKNKEVNSR